MPLSYSALFPDGALRYEFLLAAMRLQLFNQDRLPRYRRQSFASVLEGFAIFNENEAAVNGIVTL